VIGALNGRCAWMTHDFIQIYCLVSIAQAVFLLETDREKRLNAIPTPAAIAELIVYVGNASLDCLPSEF